MDERFEGRYYATWNETEGNCGDLAGAVKIRYLSETRRRYNPAGPNNTVVLRYRAEETLPWQWNGTDWARATPAHSPDARYGASSSNPGLALKPSSKFPRKTPPNGRIAFLHALVRTALSWYARNRRTGTD